MEVRIRAAVTRHGASLTSLKPLHGGACQENFKVELLLDGAPTTLALRSDAKTSLPGSLTRRVEYEVIRAAVAAGVRTPGVRWLEPGLLRDGADAYFLDWVPGEAIGRRIVRNPELSTARQRLPEQLAQSLARLHTVTPERAALPLPVPAHSPALEALATLRAMLARMPGVYPAVAFALAWLEARVPAEREVVLVHGDFRTGNFMVTPEGLAGVLDWEFAHYGSPYEDLAWLSVRDWRFTRLDLPIGGFSTRAPFYAAYEAASGRRVDEATVLWWEVVGNVRWALGSVHQGERYLSGEQPDLELIAIARRNVEMEFEALRLIRRERLD
ncbi:MAG: phosphotransferase family protein [Myxococcaceae bacterium]|nr:phosphotransferase family protein [Myxococcaceae bacterium]